jgi:hypothetical protein
MKLLVFFGRVGAIMVLVAAALGVVGEQPQ